MINEIFNEEEKDRLCELMNVSYGYATGALTKVINKYITLKVPNIKVLEIEEFKDYVYNKIGNEIYYITKQNINGKFNGESIFMMDKNSVYNLGKELDFNEEEDEREDLEDIFLEISNIISTTTISNLSNMLKSDISFNAPSIEIVNTIPDFQNYNNQYKYIIIISTKIEFENEKINGELLILSTDKTIEYIKERLNVIIEEIF